MHLPACLRSIRGLFDDIIIIDTGSRDETVLLARKEGAHVYRFPWCDDFSAARNYGLDKVKTRWVMRLDADDRLPKAQRLKMRAMLNSLDDRGPAVYMMRVASTEPSGRSYLDEHRVWPAQLGMRFRGRVHERIRPEVDARQLPVYLTDVRLDHAGYLTPRVVEAKLRRNLRLLEMEKADRLAGADRPFDPFTLFDIGRTLGGLGRHDEAIDALRHFLAIRDPGYVLASKIAFRRICDSMRALGKFKDAIRVAQQALARYPDDALLCSWVAETMEHAGEPQLARDGYALALSCFDPKAAESGMPADFPARMRAHLARLDACMNSSPTQIQTSS